MFFPETGKSTVPFWLLQVPADARPSVLAEPRSCAGLLAEGEEGKTVPLCCVSRYVAFLPVKVEAMKVITTLPIAW